MTARAYATAYVNDCSCGVSHYGLTLQAPAPDAPAGAVGQTRCPITDAVIDVYPHTPRPS